jgi:hypothetical protein
LYCTFVGCIIVVWFRQLLFLLFVFGCSVGNLGVFLSFGDLALVLECSVILD